MRNFVERLDELFVIGYRNCHFAFMPIAKAPSASIQTLDGLGVPTSVAVYSTGPPAALGPAPSKRIWPKSSQKIYRWSSAKKLTWAETVDAVVIEV
jgi:hypothetical protein